MSKLNNFWHCRWHRWQTLSCEYLREFLKKFETALMVYSGAWGKLIQEKKQKSKISWHCPFNTVSHKPKYTRNPGFKKIPVTAEMTYSTGELEPEALLLCTGHPQFTLLLPLYLSTLLTWSSLPTLSLHLSHSLACHYIYLIRQLVTTFIPLA